MLKENITVFRFAGTIFGLISVSAQVSTIGFARSIGMATAAALNPIMNMLINPKNNGIPEHTLTSINGEWVHKVAVTDEDKKEIADQNAKLLKIAAMVWSGIAVVMALTMGVSTTLSFMLVGAVSSFMRNVAQATRAYMVEKGYSSTSRMAVAFMLKCATVPLMHFAAPRFLAARGLMAAQDAANMQSLLMNPMFGIASGIAIISECALNEIKHDEVEEARVEAVQFHKDMKDLRERMNNLPKRNAKRSDDSSAEPRPAVA